MSLAGVDCRCRAEADRGEAERPELDRPDPGCAEPARPELDRPAPGSGELDRPELDRPELGSEAPACSEPGRSDDSLRPDWSLIDVTVSLIPVNHGFDSARDFRPLSAVVMMVFSARRLSMPIIGTLVPTASS